MRHPIFELIELKEFEVQSPKGFKKFIIDLFDIPVETLYQYDLQVLPDEKLKSKIGDIYTISGVKFIVIEVGDVIRLNSQKPTIRKLTLEDPENIAFVVKK